MDYGIRILVDRVLSDLKNPDSIAEMAHSANVSIDHFYKLFKRETSFSPKQFIRHHRFEKAKELLETTNLRVKEIIKREGIEDLLHSP